MTAAASKPARLWVAALCCASFFIAAAVAWGVFEAVPHLEDEHAQLFQAQVFAAGAASAPLYQPATAFEIPFTLHINGRVFSKYPPGYALLLAAGVLLGQPWLVNALAAALGTLGVWMLGRELFDDAAGLLAAGLGVAAPMSVMLSGTLLSHTSSLALLVWFAWAFFRARRETGLHPWRYALLAGVLLGLAAAARPLTAAAVGLPFGMLALWDLMRAPRRRLAAALCLGAGLLASGLLWPAYNWLNTGSPFSNTYALYWPYDSIGFGPQFGQDGHTPAEGLENIRADLAAFNETAAPLPVAWGIPLLWAAVGLGVALAPRSRWAGFLLLPVAALMLAHGAYWTRSGGLYGPRYFAEAMPFAWLLGGRGLAGLARLRWGRAALRVLLPLCLAWAIGVEMAPRFAQARGLYGITRADAHLVQQAGLQNALVFVTAPDWTDYARLSWLNAPYLERGAVIYARDGGPSSNWETAKQFAGRALYSFDRARTPALQACPEPCGLIQPPPVNYNGK